MVQSAIEFLIHNNISVIQVGFAIIFFLAVFVILKSFKEESQPKQSGYIEKPSRREEKKVDAQSTPASGGPIDDKSPLDDLDNLDELMGPDPGASAAAALAAVAAQQAAAAASAPAPAPTADVMGAAPAQAAAPTPAPTAAPSADAQNTINEKEKVIGDLKAEIAQLQEKTKGSGDTQALQDKIKELSDKLSEYEIIEDDIANLSFYKSENTKLKNELEKLRGNVTSSIEEAVAANPMPATAAPTPPPPPKEVAKAPPPPAAPAVEEPTILDEFEKAVQQKEALEKTAPENPAEKISVPKDKDLMKEFESLMDQQQAAVAAPAAVAAAPTPAAEPVPAPISNIDSQKLMKEMETMADAPPPAVAADDGKDSTQKLIEEFENFMNKASS
jgi:hypothetical protein